MNSNQKGKRGEREACKLIQSFGYEARRSQQYSGVRDDATSADIITNIRNVRLEVKYGYSVELWHKQLQDWIKTAVDETPDETFWVILYKKTRGQWTLITDLKGIIIQTTDIETVLNEFNAYNW